MIPRRLVLGSQARRDVSPPASRRVIAHVPCLADTVRSLPCRVRQLVNIISKSIQNGTSLRRASKTGLAGSHGSA